MKYKDDHKMKRYSESCFSSMFREISLLLFYGYEVRVVQNIYLKKKEEKKKERGNNLVKKKTWYQIYFFK